ncbi:MAG: RNA polymerase sigma factor [Ilumatobacteraceae bacterium]
MSEPFEIAPRSIDEIIRVEGGQVVATLARMTGRLDLAEDAFAEAALEAVRRWPVRGLPERPGAWLTTVARRKALDHLRREAERPRREEMAQALSSPVELDLHTVRDDQLRLIFTACHPSLQSASQVALTLRLVCGLTVDEIAAAFLTTSSATTRRITRAKDKLRSNRIGFRIPPDEDLPGRLASVLSVVEVIFTTGHHTVTGSALVRVDLLDEGVRLARLLAELMPDEPECRGLLALLLSTRARSATRVADDGTMVLLRDADRSRWDRAEIAEAVALLEQTLRRGRPGPFQLRAAISCLHSAAPSTEATDWPQIVQLYDMLAARDPSPVVLVNRAVAVAEARGPEDGLVALLEVADDEAMQRWHLFHATHADLLERTGDRAGARAALDRALACPHNDIDDRVLRDRRAALAGD